MSKVRSWLSHLRRHHTHTPPPGEKPVLYRFGLSVWAAVPELAIEELGLDVEAVTISIADGENFKPDFLKINPNGTLPTLTTPDGKTHTNTADVTRYLVQTASKKVTPGHPELIAKIHEDKYDPNFILLAIRNEDELKTAASGFPITFVQNRQTALEKYAASAEGAPFKDFYAKKLEGNGGILKVYKGDAPSAGFFAISTGHWQNIVAYVLNDLPEILPASGFIGGAEPGEDDFHVGAWLTRVAWVSGATNDAEGYKALEKELKGPVPEKVASYWKAWHARPSWQKVYSQTLH